MKRKHYNTFDEFVSWINEQFRSLIGRLEADSYGCYSQYFRGCRIIIIKEVACLVLYLTNRERMPMEDIYRKLSKQPKPFIQFAKTTNFYIQPLEYIDYCFSFQSTITSSEYVYNSKKHILILNLMNDFANLGLDYKIKL